MAIEKSLYAAPQGLEELAAMDQASPQIEIEIEDPDKKIESFEIRFKTTTAC